MAQTTDQGAGLSVHLPTGREGAGFRVHRGEADRWETVAMENGSWSSSKWRGTPGHAELCQATPGHMGEEWTLLGGRGEQT